MILPRKKGRKRKFLLQCRKVLQLVKQSVCNFLVFLWLESVWLIKDLGHIASLLRWPGSIPLGRRLIQGGKKIFSLSQIYWHAAAKGRFVPFLMLFLLGFILTAWLWAPQIKWIAASLGAILLVIIGLEALFSARKEERKIFFRRRKHKRGGKSKTRKPPSPQIL